MTSITKLLWLALGAFAIGTESYMIAGLLPTMSADLGVSVPMAGQLVTAFALAYAVGSPVLAVVTGNMERKRLLLFSIAAFAACNVLAVFSTNYAMLLGARILLALAAGTFMPAASAYAVAIVPPHHRGRALSIVYCGLTFATVVGVPLGVIVGERFGWRSTFAGVAVLALVALLGISFALSKMTSSVSATLSERVAIARRPDVLGALALTVIALTGAFTIYTYLAPFLQQVAGLGGHSLAAVLFLFGLGSAAGNLISGATSDRLGPTRVVASALGALIVLFVALSAIASLVPPSTAVWITVPVIVLWGFVGWSFPAAQQSRLVAMEPRLAPITLSLNASAIYLGVSLGAVIGSIVLAHGAVIDLGWVGAACEALGLATLVWALRRSKVAHPMEIFPPPSNSQRQFQNENHPSFSRRHRIRRNCLCFGRSRRTRLQEACHRVASRIPRREPGVMERNRSVCVAATIDRGERNVVVRFPRRRFERTCDSRA
jgi:predicted MFS family arabinose efflux permease